MAVKKQISVRRVNGEYFKPISITLDRNGMCSIYGDVWKDPDDRLENPDEPILSRHGFMSTDAALKEAAVKIMYELAELFSELKGGEPIFEDGQYDTTI